MRAEVYRHDAEFGDDLLLGSVVNGQILYKGTNTNASVKIDGQIRVNGDLIGIVNPDTGEVLSGSIHQPQLVGRVAENGTVYDERSQQLGSVVLPEATKLSPAERQRQVYLAGGAARMTLLNHDFYLDPDIYPFRG